MKALHAQMNPHFIFNSLNSIREMILNNENHEASRFLSKFAHLIRITLDQSRQQDVYKRQAIERAIAHGCIAFSGRITSQGFVTMSGIIATGGVK